MTRIQKSHQVALVGKRRVKQRRGWSSKKLSSSHVSLFAGTKIDETHITNRSMHGNPVLPTMMRKLPIRSGSTASWKEIIESGVSVKPRSLNIEAGVKIPLKSELALIQVLEISRDPPPSPGLTGTINYRTPSWATYDPREKRNHPK